MTTIEFLDRAVDIYGDDVGVIADDGTKFTYGEFNERVNRLSHVLADMGFEYGDRVAIFSYNTHWMLESFYATNQLGIINVPMNYRLVSSQVEYILNHSGARAVIVDPELAPVVEAVRDSVPVEQFIAVNASEVEGDWLDYETLLAGSSPERPERPAFDENDIATINYTSGTTGRSKGVMRTYRTEHWHAIMLSAHMNVSDDDTYLWTLPMFHCNGWGHVYMITGMGGTHVCFKKFNAARAFELVRKYDVTYMCGAPTVLNLLIQHFEEHPGTVTMGDKPVRLATAGSPPPAAAIETIENDFGWEIRHVYGLTETAPIITTSHLPRLTTPENKFKIKPMQGPETLGTRVRVVDDNGEDVPWDGKTLGEIVVQGNQVMDGYWDDPEATDRAFNAKRPGWFHTGDLATIDERGSVAIKDRSKDIIISGGENISSVEVEDTIYKHPAVSQCAVIGVPHEKWGETPRALVVLKRGAEATAEEIIGFCRDNLPHYMCPTSAEFVDSLPATATGKIQKYELRKRYWEGHEFGTGEKTAG